MKTLDDLLIDVGETLDRLSSAHQPRRLPSVEHLRSRWTTVAAAGVVAAAGIAALVVVVRGDASPTSVKTTEPVGSIASPTEGDATTVPIDSSVGVTSSTTPAPGGPVPGAAIPLDDVGPDGAPVVPAVLPDGYRLVMANYGEGPSAGFTISEPGGWAATYIDRSLAATPPVPTVSVQITALNGTGVYEFFPWAPGSPDVQIGPFTGRIANGEPESVTAVIPLDGDRRLVINGSRTTRAAIETIANGLHLRDDGVGADATTLPHGFEFVDEGPVDGPLGSASWQLGYAKDERMDSMFSVWATVDPVRPAILQLTAPMGREVTIGGRQMYTTPSGFVFDLSPTFQVKVEWSGRTQMEPGDEVEHLVESVVASLVAIPAEEFAALEAEATARPLSPIDLDCAVYVRMRDRDTGEVLRGSEVSATSPGSIDVDVFASQPVLDVEFVVAGTDDDNMAIESAPILRLPALGESQQSVTLTWDGTIGGVPAAAGTYYVGIRARADGSGGATCRSAGEPETADPPGTPGMVRPGMVPSAITFVVS